MLGDDAEERGSEESLHGGDDGDEWMKKEKNISEMKNVVRGERERERKRKRKR